MMTAQSGTGWLKLFYVNVFFACVAFSICVPVRGALAMAHSHFETNERSFANFVRIGCPQFEMWAH
jgi:hypothetical protein